MAQPISVLFAHYGEEWIRGSEVVLLDLLAALDKKKFRPLVWCNSCEMELACRERGYLTYRDDFQHMLDYSSPRADFSSWRRMVKKCVALCRQHQIDILHSNSLAPMQWLGPAAIETRRPVLAHLHIDYLRRSRYVLGLHAATMIVGDSAPVIAGALGDGVKPARVRVIENGVDLSRLGCADSGLRAELHIPGDALVIASVGSLIRRKGHDLLIAAFHALPVLPVPPHLIIAGSGEEEAALRAQAASLGIGSRVHLIGETRDAGRIYRAADIFALAARNEALPLVVLEAGYAGLPTVATRVGAIPRAVLDGATGLLTAPEDIGGLRDALAHLAADRRLAAAMGSAARLRVADSFSAPRMAREFEQAYASLAAIPRLELGWGRALRDTATPYFRLARFLARRATWKNHHLPPIAALAEMNEGLPLHGG